MKLRTSRPSLSHGQERILDNRLRQSNLIRKLSKLGVKSDNQKTGMGPQGDWPLLPCKGGKENHASFPRQGTDYLARRHDGWIPTVKEHAQEGH